MKKNKNLNQTSLFGDDVTRDTDGSGFVFEPRRLTQARELAGLTKQGLGELIEKSGAVIGQYESSITVPSNTVINQLAKVLGYPPAFFLSGRPLAQVDASQAHFRSLRSTRVYERLKATAYVESVWELVQAIERIVELPMPSVPSVEDSSDNMSPTDAARALRDYWELGSGPVSHLTLLMEQNGIVVTTLTLKDNEDDVSRVDAFSTYALDRPIVVTTSDRSTSVYRHRFTCAHELGHLVLHRDAIPGDTRQEREANQFAAEFLTPRAEMIEALPKSINLTRLSFMSQEWGVSLESLVRRMQETRGASDVSVRRAYQKIREQRRSGVRIDPKTVDYAGESPSLLREAMRLAESSGVSLVNIAEELQWPLQKLRNLLGIRLESPRLRLVRDDT